MQLIKLIFLLLSSGCLFAQSNIIKLHDDLFQIINDDFFEQSQVAASVYDLTEGESLFRNNDKLLLHPASNMKLLTSAAAIIYLDSSYNFLTSLYHTGVIEGDTLYGDLYLLGGLDPEFTTDDLDSLVQIVKSLGIKYISNNIYADISIKDSIYWGEGWMWDDEPDPGAPHLSALNINDNSIEVFVEGTEIDSQANIILTPETEYVIVDNRTKTVPARELNDLKIDRDWLNRKNTIIVEGEVRRGEYIDSSDHTEKLSLLEPEKYFLTLFKEHLKKEGIVVNGITEVKKLPANPVYLYSIHRSIDSVLVQVNKESDNLSTEMLLYALALNDSGAPAIAENGIETIRKLVDSIGLEPEKYSFADGSGVSRYNLVSAELLVEILIYMYNHPEFNRFYNSLAIGGVDGTLEKRMIDTDAEGRVHAKTGTLNGVSTLSGYVTTLNDHLLVFSILMQNFVEKTRVARVLQDEICNILVNYK
ncbi:MAG: D-alanyl-D-alanine carboxypeptidase/D-alanyl-D-alanine-endopeptidase [Ignavibacterium sp.]|nr:MAG: D-alanyl-D-alanine carboxypeptidase/D-alanyl-D-alanine-endopeptidase [Ignavibacterium sp.]